MRRSRSAGPPSQGGAVGDAPPTHDAWAGGQGRGGAWQRSGRAIAPSATPADLKPWADARRSAPRRKPRPIGGGPKRRSNEAGGLASLTKLQLGGTPTDTPVIRGTSNRPLMSPIGQEPRENATCAQESFLSKGGCRPYSLSLCMSRLANILVARSRFQPTRALSQTLHSPRARRSRWPSNVSDAERPTCTGVDGPTLLGMCGWSGRRYARIRPWSNSVDQQPGVLGSGRDIQGIWKTPPKEADPWHERGLGCRSCLPMPGRLKPAFRRVSTGKSRTGPEAEQGLPKQPNTRTPVGSSSDAAPRVPEEQHIPYT